MASTINYIGHGLVADDAFTFAYVEPPDSGVLDGVVYYVLAAGLTADSFEFSLSVGGTPVTLASNITYCDIMAAAGYEVVTDGVMDPPVVPGTPDQPVLTADTDTGVVRIVINLVAPTSPTVRAVEVQITDDYDPLFTPPDAPLFENAQVINLPPNAIRPLAGGRNRMCTCSFPRWQAFPIAVDRISDCFWSFFLETSRACNTETKTGQTPAGGPPPLSA